MQQQMDVLCMLSNNHKRPYPKYGGRTPSQSTTRIGFLRHLSFQAPYQASHIPSSPRNRFIYFENNNNYHNRQVTLNNYFGSHPEPPATNVEYNEPLFPDQPARKTRKITQRTIKVTAQTLKDYQLCAPNQVIFVTNAYSNFKLKIVEVGSLFWRLHSDREDYFIMNEYCENGEIVPNSFEEVVVCSCETYRVISAIACQDEDDVIPYGLLCMHCHFAKEEIKPRSPSLLTDNAAASTKIQVMLEEIAQ
jgi:hypothetical protein